MKAPTMAALVMWLAPLAACTDEPESEVAEVQQDERIEVHACRPGWLGDGDVCIDPWHMGGGGEGGGGGSRERTPGGGPGGHGGPAEGGHGADPYPIPSPKDCTQEISLETCVQCCDWNVEKVWGERCRRMPQRTKKQRAERRLCWADAEDRRGACQRECPPTTAVAP
jgi:hypothetical protein